MYFLSSVMDCRDVSIYKVPWKGSFQRTEKLEDTMVIQRRERSELTSKMESLCGDGALRAGLALEMGLSRTGMSDQGPSMSISTGSRV